MAYAWRDPIHVATAGRGHTKRASGSGVTEGLPQSWGCKRQEGIVASFVGGESGRVAWILRLVKIGAESEVQAQDVMEIDRPDDLGDISDLGLTLSETKRLLAALQQEIVAVQVRQHAARRPICSRCGDACRVKDYREHVVATLFGQVTVRLPRFRCAACGGIEAGVDWVLSAIAPLRWAG